MTKLKVTTQMVCNQNKIIRLTVRKQRWRKAVIKDKVTCKDSTKIALMSSCLIWNKIYYPKNLTRNFRKNLVRSSKWKDRKKSSCGALCAFWRQTGLIKSRLWKRLMWNYGNYYKNRKKDCFKRMYSFGNFWCKYI